MVRTHSSPIAARYRPGWPGTAVTSLERGKRLVSESSCCAAPRASPVTSVRIAARKRESSARELAGLHHYYMLASELGLARRGMHVKLYESPALAV